tara:strand:- start:502 stop:2931 length:2430 start_codon:yes stop_codon:yes gene_type:complete
MACQYKVGDINHKNPNTNNKSNYGCGDIKKEYYTDVDHWKDECNGSFFFENDKMKSCKVSGDTCTNEGSLISDSDNCSNKLLYKPPVAKKQPFSKTKCTSSPIDTKTDLKSIDEIESTCESNPNCKYATFQYNDSKITGTVNFYDENCITDYLKQTNLYTDSNTFTYSKGENRLTDNKWISDNLKQLIGSSTLDSKEFFHNKKLLFFIKQIDLKRLKYIINNYKHPDYNLTDDHKNIIQHALSDSHRFSTYIDKDYDNLIVTPITNSQNIKFKELSIHHKDYLFAIDINEDQPNTYKCQKDENGHYDFSNFQKMGKVILSKIYTNTNDLWGINFNETLFKIDTNNNTATPYVISAGGTNTDIKIKDFAISDRKDNYAWVLGTDNNIYYCITPITNSSIWTKLPDSVNLDSLFMDSDRLLGINSTGIYEYDEVKSNFIKKKDNTNELLTTYCGKGSEYIYGVNSSQDIYKIKKLAASSGNTDDFTFTKLNLTSKYIDVKANNDNIYVVTVNNTIEELKPKESYKIIVNNDRSQVLKVFDTLSKMYQVFTTPNGMVELGTWKVHNRTALDAKTKETYDAAKKMVEKFHKVIDDHGTEKGWSQEKKNLYSLHETHNRLVDTLDVKVNGDKNNLATDKDKNLGYYLKDRSLGTKFWQGPAHTDILQENLHDGLKQFYNISANSAKKLFNSTEDEILKPTHVTYDIVKVFSTLSAFEAITKMIGPRGAFWVLTQYHKKTDGTNSITGTTISEPFVSKSNIPKYLLKKIHYVLTTGKNEFGKVINQDNLFKIISFYGKRIDGKYIFNKDLENALS